MKNNKLTKNYAIVIDQKAFDDVFFDTFNDVGYCATAIGLNQFNEMHENGYSDEQSFNTVYEQLPNELKKYEQIENHILLVKSDNIETHINNHVINTRESDNNVGYLEMIKTIANHNLNLIPDYNDYENENLIYCDIDDDFKNNLVKYATDKIKSESQLTINGQKFYIEFESDLDRNWVSEYLKSKK